MASHPSILPNNHNNDHDQQNLTGPKSPTSSARSGVSAPETTSALQAFKDACKHQINMQTWPISTKSTHIADASLPAWYAIAGYCNQTTKQRVEPRMLIFSLCLCNGSCMCDSVPVPLSSDECSTYTFKPSKTRSYW